MGFLPGAGRTETYDAPARVISKCSPRTASKVSRSLTTPAATSSVSQEVIAVRVSVAAAPPERMASAVLKSVCGGGWTRRARSGSSGLAQPFSQFQASRTSS